MKLKSNNNKTKIKNHDIMTKQTFQNKRVICILGDKSLEY